MAHVIALAQRKGGVGKTTLAIGIAAEIRLCGYSVAVVDADPQRSASEWAEPGGLDFPVHAINVAELSVMNWAVDYLLVDTAPNDQALAAAAAFSNVVLLPCMPSGLDIEATVHSLKIVNAVRQRRRAPLHVILVPNRVDIRTLEGRQLMDELKRIGETVGPAVGNRSIFVRTFSTGRSVCDQAPGSNADREIRALWLLVQRILKSGTV